MNFERKRFDQPNFRVYHHLEVVLLKSVRGDKIIKEKLDFSLDFHKDNLDKIHL